MSAPDFNLVREVDEVFVGSRTAARLATIRAYRDAARLLLEMANKLEDEPIDAVAFFAVEARCVAELNRAHVNIERLKQVEECVGEA